LGVYPEPGKRGITYEDLHPPLGLEFIASAVKDLVDKVTVVDMRYEAGPLPVLLAEADVIGLSVNWRQQKDLALEIAATIPPGPTVIVGGIQPTQDPAEFLKPSGRVDIVVLGDGEAAMREIFSGRPLAEVRGIAYKENGRTTFTAARPLTPVTDLFPDRRLRRYAYRYRLPWGASFSIDCLMSSRGCCHHCEFCTYRLDSAGRKRPWAGRSAASVVDEILTMDADLIIFTDDHFGQDVRRVEEICDRLISLQVKKNLSCETRIEIAKRPDILRKMERAGFKGLSFGLESCQDKTLARIGKGFTRRDLEAAFRVLRSFDFFLVGYFIVGYIGESVSDALEIADFAQGLGLDFIGLSFLRAFGHSSLRESLRSEPGYYIGENDLVLRRGTSQKDLEGLARSIVRRFYSPRQILKIVAQGIRSPVPNGNLLNFALTLMVTEWVGRQAKVRIGCLC